MSSHDEEPEPTRPDELEAALPSGPGTRGGAWAGTYRAELEKANAVDEDGVRRLSFSAYMRVKRKERGLSMRQAAKHSGISEGRWRQLEAGYQSVRGEKIPVKTTEETVLRIAAGMEMHPDIALVVAGLFGTNRVKISETGIWPLPKHKTIKRDLASGEPQIVKDLHVTSSTLHQAKYRLRTLETICELIQTLPVRDIEYVQSFIEDTLSECYAERERIDEEHAHDVARLEQGYSDEEGD